MTGAPWTFDQAYQKCLARSAAQKQAEEFFKQAAKDFAEAEEAYRVALAKEIVRQHAEEGVAWTVAPDLARGEKAVAELRRKRDIAEGVREAASQASWRASADRKDTQRFVQWSMARELAEAAGSVPEPDPADVRTFGARRAA